MRRLLAACIVLLSATIAESQNAIPLGSSNSVGSVTITKIGSETKWTIVQADGSSIVVGAGGHFPRGFVIHQMLNGVLEKIEVVNSSGQPVNVTPKGVVLQFAKPFTRVLKVARLAKDGRAVWWASNRGSTDALHLYSPKCVDSPNGEPECAIDVDFLGEWPAQVGDESGAIAIRLTYAKE